MAHASNLTRDVLVMNLEKELEEQIKSMYVKDIASCSNEELYYALLLLSKKLMQVSETIEGEKKVYYISAEFLIGKLLSNNLINLGIYDRLNDILRKNGKSLSGTVTGQWRPWPSGSLFSRFYCNIGAAGGRNRPELSFRSFQAGISG